MILIFHIFNIVVLSILMKESEALVTLVTRFLIFTCKIFDIFVAFDLEIFIKLLEHFYNMTDKKRQNNISISGELLFNNELYT